MADAPAICSAKGCRAAAEYTLVWNNPKVHEPDREKTWLACAGHRDSLGEFLRIRGFLRRIDPFTAPATGPTGATGSGG